MKQIETKSIKKMPQNFICECCDFKCSKQSNYTNHLLTRKHKMKQNETKTDAENADVIFDKLQCPNCLQDFNSRTTLWRHKKYCTQYELEPVHIDATTQLTPELIIKLIEQNKQMIELAKNTAGHHNTNHVNSHNKTFNLQVFLNETCKNAINISDFINQLQVSISDLEETGKLGFTEGISKIFINGLKDIDIPDRPLHCSDLKRETIYIKNNNEWTKDTEENLLLVNAIKQVSNKNMKQITEWQKVNPEYKDSSSKINDRYLKIVSESMSGSTKEECDKNYKKIIKNIAKETVIDKTIA